jgi:hypothetical protein
VRAHEKKLLQHLRRSDREKPDLQLVRSGDEPRGRHAAHPPTPQPTIRPDLHFQVESFAAIADELPPLFARHWDELGEKEVELDPDWNRMFVSEAQGQLRIITARYGEVLVGYIFNIIGRHPHSQSTFYSNIDNFWLDPNYRGGWAVMRWLKLNEAMLDELGVKKRYIGVRNDFMSGRVGNLFRRLGYKPVESTWSR